MRRSRSTSNLFLLDPEIERTLHRARKELESRYKIERELDILVQPQPTVTAGLSHEDPQRHIQNILEITDTYNYLNVSKDYVRLTLFSFSLLGEAKEWLHKEPANSIHTWDDLAKKFLIKFFPTKKTKSLRSQILGFQQRDGETLRQAWERYKKLLRDCPHHCQIDEVLGYTFVDGLDETSKMNPDSACGGSCMARPYSEIQLLLNNLTANDHNWQGALPRDAKKNPQVSAITLRTGRELEEVPKKRKDKPIPEGELIPKATQESNKDDTVSAPVNVPRPPPPFPQRLQKKNDDRMFNKFLSMLSQIQLNIPFVDAIRDIPKYAKYIKDIVANKRRLIEFETVALTEECTSRVQNKLPQKLKDPDSFIIPVRIGNVDVGHALCDLGASINFMSLSLYKNWGWELQNPPL
ncbi:uncharacterized protein [Nicotiana sylvestris]|uniref:uncharacterized protein n=1 Tax=Nicotiana sylvestris TaxID=4096 RepID=UPI00388C77EB